MPMPLSSTETSNCAFSDPARHRDAAAGLGELDRIRQQVEHDLLEGALVGDDVGQIVGIAHDQFEAGVARLQRQQVAAID